MSKVNEFLDKVDDFNNYVWQNSRNYLFRLKRKKIERPETLDEDFIKVLVKKKKDIIKLYQANKKEIVKKDLSSYSGRIFTNLDSISIIRKKIDEYKVRNNELFNFLDFAESISVTINGMLVDASSLSSEQLAYIALLRASGTHPKDRITDITEGKLRAYCRDFTRGFNNRYDTAHKSENLRKSIQNNLYNYQERIKFKHEVANTIKPFLSAKQLENIKAY